MTNLEFQTVTDLQRVRTIRTELDALELSENFEGTAFASLAEMRRDVRAWEKALFESLTIKTQRADAGKSRESKGHST